VCEAGMYVSDSACEADVLYIYERTATVGESVRN